MACCREAENLEHGVLSGSGALGACRVLCNDEVNVQKYAKIKKHQEMRCKDKVNSHFIQYHFRLHIHVHSQAHYQCQLFPQQKQAQLVEMSSME